MGTGPKLSLWVPHPFSSSRDGQATSLPDVLGKKLFSLQTCRAGRMWLSAVGGLLATLENGAQG